LHNNEQKYARDEWTTRRISTATNIQIGCPNLNIPQKIEAFYFYPNFIQATGENTISALSISILNHQSWLYRGTWITTTTQTATFRIACAHRKRQRTKKKLDIIGWNYFWSIVVFCGVVNLWIHNISNIKRYLLIYNEWKDEKRRADR